MLRQVAALAAAGSVAQAQSLCAATVQQHPSCAHAHYMLGALSSAAGEHAAAEPHYRRACQLAPAHAAAACNLGQTLLARGAHAEALVTLRRATTLAPTLPEAHINLASALRALGETAAATASAEQALALVPRMAAAVSLRGRLALDAGDAKRALELSQRAAAASASAAADSTANADAGEGGPLAGAACELGALALEALGRPDEALATLSRAVARWPGSGAAADAAALRASLAWRALRSHLQPRGAPAAAAEEAFGDVFVASFPKAGTTWVQLIACMLCGEAADVSVQRRAPWIEAAVATGACSLAQLASLPRDAPRIFKTHAAAGGLPVAGCITTIIASTASATTNTTTAATIAAASSSLAEGCEGAERGTTTSGASRPVVRVSVPPPGVRVLAVVRDPRDVCLSLYHHSRAIRAVSYRGSWAEWVGLFLDAKAPLPMSGGGGGGGGSSRGGGGGGGGGAGGAGGAGGGGKADDDDAADAGDAAADWFLHTLSWWRAAEACPAQVLVISYEALLASPADEIARIGTFLRPRQPPSAAAVARIVAASDFATMKARHEQPGGDGATAAPLRHRGEAGHFRAGAAGGWRERCTRAERARFGAEIRRRLAGSGLLERFPHWAQT